MENKPIRPILPLDRVIRMRFFSDFCPICGSTGVKKYLIFGQFICDNRACRCRTELKNILTYLKKVKEC